MNFCTSGRSHPDLSTPNNMRHNPCGKALRIIGYTTHKKLPVETCLSCDGKKPNE